MNTTADETEVVTCGCHLERMPDNHGHPVARVVCCDVHAGLRDDAVVDHGLAVAKVDPVCAGMEFMLEINGVSQQSSRMRHLSPNEVPFVSRLQPDVEEYLARQAVRR